ncbi:MAG: hypothetical protein HQM16_09795, partial [Deltaproteobacteria bacterium]|nr:hypothetical protein [Deltaproteobacteria bacterium]
FTCFRGYKKGRSIANRYPGGGAGKKAFLAIRRTSKVPCAYYKIKNNFVVTLYHEESITENGVRIHIIPAWRWLLESD